MQILAAFAKRWIISLRELPFAIRLPATDNALFFVTGSSCGLSRVEAFKSG